jgi:hypothetical protein
VTLAVGTGVVLGACFIIADYINAKMTVKELQTELHDCQRRLYDIEHPAAARRFRDQEPETSRWLALLLASDCGRRLQAIIPLPAAMDARSVTSPLSGDFYFDGARQTGTGEIERVMRAVPKVTAMRQTKERRKTYLSASRHDEAPIIHVQPIAPTNKLVLGVPREWAIGFRAKIGFVKSGHERQLHKRPNQAHF